MKRSLALLALAAVVNTTDIPLLVSVPTTIQVTDGSALAGMPEGGYNVTISTMGVN